MPQHWAQHNNLSSNCKYSNSHTFCSVKEFLKKFIRKIIFFLSFFIAIITIFYHLLLHQYFLCNIHSFLFCFCCLLHFLHSFTYLYYLFSNSKSPTNWKNIQLAQQKKAPWLRSLGRWAKYTLFISFF